MSLLSRSALVCGAPSFVSFVVILAVSSLLVACGGDDAAGPPAPLTVPSGCNPIAADWDCLLPFPSDVFRVDDPNAPGAKAVLIPEIAQPHTNAGHPVDALASHPADGFSLGSQILAVFPAGVDPSNLLGATSDLELSVTAESPTVLLDAKTGERVPHLAELDPRSFDDARRAFVIRPLVRLEPERRYIVGVHGLKALGGGPVAPPEGFRRLRDHEAASSPALSGLTAHYDADIFPELEAAGVPRANLTLAWDFTTASEGSLTRDMLAVRGGVVKALQATPPTITVTGVKDDVTPHIKRRIDATINVPLYLESTEVSAKLSRDAKGDVAQNGEAAVPITILIPTSVANRAPGDPPARLLQYGHGFFGSREEAADTFVTELADELSFVVVAADWWGMSDPDKIEVANTITLNPGEIMGFTDRVHQAMANFIALGEAAAGPLASLPEAALGPQPMFDPTSLYFYGISQGGVLGGTFLALSPRIKHGALGVNGANLSLMMFRAQPFIPFLLVIGSVIADPLDVQKLCALTQSTFDRVDPLTYAPHVLADPYPGSPPDRRVLSQIGVGDAAVPNLASHLEARALGLALLAPAPRPLPFLTPKDAPLDGSALVEFDLGVSPLPGETATPSSKDNGVHEGVRRLPASKAQIDAFFRPGGMIINPCSGACDPD